MMDLLLAQDLNLSSRKVFENFLMPAYTQLQAGYSFSTGAYRIRYIGEWIKAIGKADFTLQALAKAPNNTINFFGLGNETEYDKTGDYKTYYRTRYSTYQLTLPFAGGKAEVIL